MVAINSGQSVLIVVPWQLKWAENQLDCGPMLLALRAATPSPLDQVIINLITNPILGDALLTMCALAQPARQSLSQGQIDDLRLAASKMTGAERRAFMAEMALKYCGGGARLAETVFVIVRRQKV